jgi:hypothetical protein
METYVPWDQQNHPELPTLEETFRRNGIKLQVVRENPIPISPDVAHTLYAFANHVTEAVLTTGIISAAKHLYHRVKARKTDRTVPKIRVIIQKDRRDEENVITLDMTKDGVLLTGKILEDEVKSAPKKAATSKKAKKARKK